MKVTTSVDGDVAVLDLEGNLTVGEADTAFSAAVERMSERGHSVIVVDLDGVEFIDSTGLGSIVRSHHRCLQNGGGIRLANVSFQVWNLLETARLTEIIPVFETRIQAIDGSSGE
jgi:anti-sigma B factor antagonist